MFMPSTVFTIQRFAPRESYQKTRAAAEKALELDDRLAEAHTAFAIVKFLNDGDWEGSQLEISASHRWEPQLRSGTPVVCGVAI